jgi:putative membrane protein
MRFLARLMLNALAIVCAAWLVPGVTVNGTAAALLAGVFLGLVNVAVRPILLVLTFPFTLVTLGLFIFVVNAICLGLTAALIPGFEIEGFWSALGGAFVVSVVSWILNGLLVGKPPSGRDDQRRR